MNKRYFTRVLPALALTLAVFSILQPPAYAKTYLWPFAVVDSNNKIVGLVVGTDVAYSNNNGDVYRYETVVAIPYKGQWLPVTARRTYLISYGRMLYTTFDCSGTAYAIPGDGIPNAGPFPITGTRNSQLYVESGAPRYVTTHSSYVDGGGCQQTDAWLANFVPLIPVMNLNFTPPFKVIRRPY